jgi:hypothetical protein
VQELFPKIISIDQTLRAIPNDNPLEIQKTSLDQSLTYLFDTSISYSVDVQKDQKFIPHCRPGEWVVCNCITEGGDYVRLDEVEINLESEEAEEPTANSTDTPKF